MSPVLMTAVVVRGGEDTQEIVPSVPSFPDGPRFARDSPGATEKDWQFYGGEPELRGLKINWEPGAQANFFGCNTAVSFAQKFANAQGTSTWGFNTSSSFSGDPSGKSKMYMLQPWNPNLYMTGRDGRSMVRRAPQQPKR